MRFELTTSSLPRKCSTPELQQQKRCSLGCITLQPLRGSCDKPSTHNEHRAADEIRTRDIQLGRLTLYQLSYHRLSKNQKSTKYYMHQLTDER